jgi:hypothetical protein
MSVDAVAYFCMGWCTWSLVRGCWRRFRLHRDISAMFCHAVGHRYETSISHLGPARVIWVQTCVRCGHTDHTEGASL